jgi:predicted O-methyltransferase YrrM
MPGYFTLSMQLSKPGTVILFDNVVRDGEVANAESQDGRVVGVRKLMDMLSTDPRVDSTALQTVGLKGYDGFAFALVNG